LLCSAQGVQFLTSQLATTVGPLQFLREITQNGIEAGADLIVWRPFGPPYGDKLCAIDTGHGMGPEMVSLIGGLASSGRDQGQLTNFGVGTKISSVIQNPLGLIYMSKKKGEDAVLAMLQRTEGPDGSWYYGVVDQEDGRLYKEIPDSALPPEIQKAGQGTCVIFMGKSQNEDTTKLPEGVNRKRVFSAGARWIAGFLNMTYFTLPKGVTIRVVYSKPKKSGGGGSQHVGGSFAVELEKNSESSGVVNLTRSSVPCKVRWWIKSVKRDSKNRVRDRGRQSYVMTKSHSAILTRSENAPDGLVEMMNVRRGRENRALIQSCGVPLGHQRVVLYFEPDPSKVRVDLTRTQVVTISGGGMPWEEWQDEFRENLPQEIIDLVTKESCKAGDVKDRKKRLREQLGELLRKFVVTSCAPAAEGEVGEHGLLFNEADQGGVEGPGDVTPSNEEGGGGGGGGGGGRRRFRPDDMIPGKIDPAKKKDFRQVVPDVIWLSSSGRPECAERPEGVMTGRAAMYISAEHALHVNADWVFWDWMTDRFFERLLKKEGFPQGHPVPEWLRRRVRDVDLRRQAEVILVRVVMGTMQVARESAAWTKTHIDQCLSEEALTSSAIGSYGAVLEHLPRVVGTKVGSLKAALTGSELEPVS
jgi:hypothetical protein